MKKFFTSVLILLFAMSSYAVDKKKVAEAKLKSIDEMLNYALSLNDVPGALNGIGNTQLVSNAYSQLGYELPTDITALSYEGTPVKKITKLQGGDIVFFNNDLFGIVYKSNSDKTISFLHLVDGKVMVSSSNGLTFSKGQHITSDKELSTLRKEYISEQKAIAKANANAEKAKKKAEAEMAKAEKARIEAEKAAAEADKANKKRDDLINKTKD